MTNGYYLVSKISKLPYYKYKGTPLRLINQSARTVDEVVVCSKKNPKIKRQITTFYNSDGNIIERVLNFSDKPYRNRVYLTCDNIINPNEFVKSTFVKEYSLPRFLKQIYIDCVKKGFNRTHFWDPVKFFANHFSENIETGEKVLTQVKQTNLLKPKKETHTFIEFPHIVNGKIKKDAKKILRFSVNIFNAYKVNAKNVLEQGAKIPCNDSFLGLRALDIEESKTAFCEKFILERGLSGKNIKIETQYLPQDAEEELYKAMFDPNDGSIDFIKNYKFKSKSEVCATSRHETEHGWQFYLHARNTQGGTTPWEERIYNRFRDLPASMKKEAQEYTDSIRNYVTVASDRKKYLQNFIEICANEQGAKVRVLYDNERAEIQKEFPHIPQEFL